MRIIQHYIKRLFQVVVFPYFSAQNACTLSKLVNSCECIVSLKTDGGEKVKNSNLKLNNICHKLFYFIPEMIKCQFHCILSGAEGNVNKSFVQWTVIESAMHQGLEFEIGLENISEQYRHILCPHAANIVVREDDNKYKPNKLWNLLEKDEL